MNHLIESLRCHSDRFQHGEFPPPDRNGRRHGIKDIRRTDCQNQHHKTGCEYLDNAHRLPVAFGGSDDIINIHAQFSLPPALLYCLKLLH